MRLEEVFEPIYIFKKEIWHKEDTLDEHDARDFVQYCKPNSREKQ